MPPPPAKPVAPRKRNRKRKRRAASESSSESSSSDSESEVEAQPTIAKKVVTKPAAQEESPSESSSESSSDSDSEPEQRYHVAPSATLKQPIATKPIHTRRKSPSPSPPPSKIPSFLPTLESAGQDVVEQEKVMKERFRTFWMSSVADGFKSDLEEIRKVHLSNHPSYSHTQRTRSGTQLGTFTSLIAD